MDFFQVHISSQAIESATEVLKSGWINEGRKVKQFQSELSTRLGLRRPVTVNSGTATLVLALAVAGLGPGDEAILSAQTFIATGMVISIVIFDNTYLIAEEHEDQRINGASREILRHYSCNLVNFEIVSWYTPGIAIWQKSPFDSMINFKNNMKSGTTDVLKAAQYAGTTK